MLINEINCDFKFSFSGAHGIPIGHAAVPEHATVPSPCFWVHLIRSISKGVVVIATHRNALITTSQHNLCKTVTNFNGS